MLEEVSPELLDGLIVVVTVLLLVYCLGGKESLVEGAACAGVHAVGARGVDHPRFTSVHQTNADEDAGLAARSNFVVLDQIFSLVHDSRTPKRT
eukprot:3805899-Rhodomonas_salina.1